MGPCRAAEEPERTFNCSLKENILFLSCDFSVHMVNCWSDSDGLSSSFCFVDVYFGAVLRLFLEINDGDAHEEFHHADRATFWHLHHGGRPDRWQLWDGYLLPLHPPSRPGKASWSFVLPSRRQATCCSWPWSAISGRSCTDPESFQGDVSSWPWGPSSPAWPTSSWDGKH